MRLPTAIDDWILRQLLPGVNVAADKLEAVCALLPCMREPTIATLHDAAGFAVKAAVRRDTLPTLVPRIKIAGGTDVVITPISQIVP